MPLIEFNPHHFNEALCSHNPKYVSGNGETPQHRKMKEDLAAVALASGWRVGFEIRCVGVNDVVCVHDDGRAAILEAIWSSGPSCKLDVFERECTNAGVGIGLFTTSGAPYRPVSGMTLIQANKRDIRRFLSSVEYREGKLPTPLAVYRGFTPYGFRPRLEELGRNDHPDPRVRDRVISTCKSVIWDQTYGSQIVDYAFGWLSDEDLERVGLTRADLAEAKCSASNPLAAYLYRAGAGL